MKKLLKNIANKINHTFFTSHWDRELIRVKNNLDGGIIVLYEKPFHYHHGRSFYDTYKEIFESRIYEFKTKSEKPLIIDCGANMGLSVLYFSKNYKNAEIIAFEPDLAVLECLNKNIHNQNLDNVILYDKAVWKDNADLKFLSDKGMGGRLSTDFIAQEPQIVQALRLKDFLNRPVDMLKLDIEGAEYIVMKDCENQLHNVKHIFVEYHSSIDEEQHLEDILSILKHKGFRYHLKQSFSRTRPFVDSRVVCQKFDMAINIFAYRN
ncbi:MAG: FkbM family methyltransferase [Gelidibacter sp.]